MANVFTRMVGGIEVITLFDGQMRGSVALFPDYEAHRAHAAAAQAGIPFDGAQVIIEISSFVVKTAQAVVLVDAGSPPGFGETAGQFTEALALARIDPKEVTHLAMTHLHIDHVGGLIDTQGKARFENAELISGAGDWDFFTSDAVMARANERIRQSLQVSRNSILPYAERRRELQGEAEIASGLRMMPLPGHTPGHSGILVEDGDSRLLIWGDTIHSEAFQLAEPGWGVAFDVDTDRARTTRKALFERVVIEDIPVAGQHVRFPGFGKLERATTGYRLIRED